MQTSKKRSHSPHSLSSRAKFIGLVETLEYLHKGGRIGNAQKLVGSLLRIKPMLEVRDGIAHPLERARSKSKGIGRIQQLVADAAPLSPPVHHVHDGTRDRRRHRGQLGSHRNRRSADRRAPGAGGGHLPRARFDRRLLHQGRGVLTRVAAEPRPGNRRRNSRARDSVAARLASLRGILALEQSRGFDNSAVAGGLDRFIEKFTRYRPVARRSVRIQGTKLRGAKQGAATGLGSQSHRPRFPG